MIFQIFTIFSSSNPFEIYISATHVFYINYTSIIVFSSLSWKKMFTKSTFCFLFRYSVCHILSLESHLLLKHNRLHLKSDYYFPSSSSILFLSLRRRKIDLLIVHIFFCLQTRERKTPELRKSCLLIFFSSMRNVFNRDSKRNFCEKK